MYLPAGRLDMLRVLGGHGADLGATDSAGDSALYWAARQGHAAVIRWLVEQGVSLDTQNKVSTTNTTCYNLCAVQCFIFIFCGEESSFSFYCLFSFSFCLFSFHILLGLAGRGVYPHGLQVRAHRGGAVLGRHRHQPRHARPRE